MTPWNRLLAIRNYGLMSAGLLLLPLAFARAQVVSATVPAGPNPVAIAVNPVTNKIYVADCILSGDNQHGIDGNVTVIDGATNATTTITVGVCPIGVAVNPANLLGDNYSSDAVRVRHDWRWAAERQSRLSQRSAGCDRKRLYVHSYHGWRLPDFLLARFDSHQPCKSPRGSLAVRSFLGGHFPEPHASAVSRSDYCRYTTAALRRNGRNN